MRTTDSDPALKAISDFREVERGFERWLDQDNQGLFGRDEADRQEVDWQKDYLARLDVAVRAVPSSLEGVQALAVILAHQQDMGAPASVIGLACRSIERGVAGLTDSERRSA